MIVGQGLKKLTLNKWSGEGSLNQTTTSKFNADPPILPQHWNWLWVHPSKQLRLWVGCIQPSQNVIVVVVHSNCHPPVHFILIISPQSWTLLQSMYPPQVHPGNSDFESVALPHPVFAIFLCHPAFYFLFFIQQILQLRSYVGCQIYWFSLIWLFMVLLRFCSCFKFSKFLMMSSHKCLTYRISTELTCNLALEIVSENCSWVLILPLRSV